MCDNMRHTVSMMRLLLFSAIIVVLTVLSSLWNVDSFTISPPPLLVISSTTSRPATSQLPVLLLHQYSDTIRRTSVLHKSRPDSLLLSSTAGNFEWGADDDNDQIDFMDQGVDNPYTKADLMDDDGTLKIDPARLLSPRMNGSNLYLVGMMGSGKSAVGRIIAKRMGTYTFLDTDEIIEKATNMSIPDIFRLEGEEAFRDVEAQVLDSVHTWVRCVISSGGGMVCRMENWSKLHTGLVVWLDVDPEVIYTRIKDSDRPLLQTNDPLQTLRDILNTRKKMYENADVRITINEHMDENMVADMVIRELHTLIDVNPPAWKLAKQRAQAEGLDWVK